MVFIKLVKSVSDNFKAFFIIFLEICDVGLMGWISFFLINLITIIITNPM
jgi:hypothetical protein